MQTKSRKVYFQSDFVCTTIIGVSHMVVTGIQDGQVFIKIHARPLVRFINNV